MKTFRLPKKVKVGGIVFDVSLDDLHLKDNSMGCIRHLLHEIVVDVEADRVKTLLHEIIHAYEYQLSSDITEAWTERISFALLAFITDNPTLIRNLVDYLEDQP